MTKIDAGAAAEQRADEGREPRVNGGFGSLGSIVFLLVAAWASFLALLPLDDNSFFTHLATGRLILERGSVPSSDPYSYTAGGTPWTVQSWLPSLTYAGVERVWGATGLRLVVLVVFLIAAWLLWALTREAKAIIPRLLLITAGMVVASGTWSERPYMVGVIGMALVWLTLDRRVPAWLLIPYGWIWANSHGSFPLGLGLCVAVIAGTWIDRRSISLSNVRSELRVLVCLVGGVIAGVLSPLGSRALTFPLGALARSDTFALIQEWQAPAFTSASDRAFLALLVVAIAAVASTGTWRHVMPLVLFAATALIAQRNITMTLPVLLVVASSAAPLIGSLRSSTRPAIGKPAAVTTVGLLLLVCLWGLRSMPVDLAGYPSRPLAFLTHSEVNGEVLAQDFTGNLIEVLDGANAAVFIDDRVDMFPEAVLQSYLKLHRAGVGWSAVLDEYRIGTILWERSHPMAEVLASDPAWRVAFSDTRWLMVQRRA